MAESSSVSYNEYNVSNASSGAGEASSFGHSGNLIYRVIQTLIPPLQSKYAQSYMKCKYILRIYSTKYVYKQKSVAKY